MLRYIIWDVTCIRGRGTLFYDVTDACGEEKLSNKLQSAIILLQCIDVGDSRRSSDMCCGLLQEYLFLYGGL